VLRSFLFIYIIIINLYSTFATQMFSYQQSINTNTSQDVFSKCLLQLNHLCEKKQFSVHLILPRIQRVKSHFSGTLVLHPWASCGCVRLLAWNCNSTVTGIRKLRTRSFIQGQSADKFSYSPRTINERTLLISGCCLCRRLEWQDMSALNTDNCFF
jgi:hypothetical protein